MERNDDSLQQNGKPYKGDTSTRGFASMDPERQRQIARQGGRAAHEKGTAHEFNSNEAREAGRKGGEVVSRDRIHMSEIGRKGGRSSGNNRKHTDQPHDNRDNRDNNIY